MTKEQEKWINIQILAKKTAKKELLEFIIKTTGLDEYISDLIGTHEQQYHNQD